MMRPVKSDTLATFLVYISDGHHISFKGGKTYGKQTV